MQQVDLRRAASRAGKGAFVRRMCFTRTALSKATVIAELQQTSTGVGLLAAELL